MSPTAGPGTEPAPTAPAPPSEERLVVYGLVGMWLGLIFVKSEVASWFRIQEMFRFQAFHMYGVIGTAVVAGAIGVWILKRSGARTVRGDPIAWPGPDFRTPRRRHLLGGTVFGLGWGLLGACPGPIFALIGTGASVMIVGLLGAMAGAWTYGLLKPRLPH
jgi:uncharacterized membrane protein YedE/YeeE